MCISPTLFRLLFLFRSRKPGERKNKEPRRTEEEEQLQDLEQKPNTPDSRRRTYAHTKSILPHILPLSPPTHSFHSQFAGTDHESWSGAGFFGLMLLLMLLFFSFFQNHGRALTVRASCFYCWHGDHWLDHDHNYATLAS